MKMSEYCCEWCDHVGIKQVVIHRAKFAIPLLKNKAAV